LLLRFVDKKAESGDIVHASAIKLFILIKKYLLGLNNVMANRPSDNYDVPITNADSTYFNINQCFSYNNHLPNATMVCLSGQPCSELIIWNDTGQDVYIFAGPDDSSGDFAKYGLDQSRALLLPKLSDTETSSITIRGLTNSNQVSAKKAAAGSADEMIYYRTQFFSNNPSR